MKLKPMADNVLLKQNEAQETAIGGIILATANKEKPAIYEVVAVGPGKKDVEMLLRLFLAALGHPRTDSIPSMFFLIMSFVSLRQVATPSSLLIRPLN